MMKIVRGSFHKINIWSISTELRLSPHTPPLLCKILAIFNLLHFTFLFRIFWTCLLNCYQSGVQARCGKQQCRVSLFMTGRDTEGDCKEGLHQLALCSAVHAGLELGRNFMCQIDLIYTSRYSLVNQFFLYIQTKK